jgi:NADPH-dependent 2,4-dienoyl-CoA reductase/sulfur reductase-like enzyme
VTMAAGHAVVIAGGGPTGLMLAAELALAGVDVADWVGPELAGALTTWFGPPAAFSAGPG